MIKAPIKKLASRSLTVLRHLLAWSRTLFVSYQGISREQLEQELGDEEIQWMNEALRTGRAYGLKTRDKGAKSNIAEEKPQQLPGSFWVVTTYFNPHGDKYRKANYELFRERLQTQGANLLTVEHASSQSAMELVDSDAEILLQFTGGNTLWQKERLLNIAISNLPDDCDKIAWLDSDIVFTDASWISETTELLRTYKVVQPFSFVVHLPKNSSKIDLSALRETAASAEIQASFMKQQQVKRTMPRSYSFSSPNFRVWGMPGLAWAARRELLERVPLYDRAIVGGGDAVFAKNLVNRVKAAPFRDFSPRLRQDSLEYGARLREEVAGSSTHREGVILHCWHGEKVFRKYRSRYQILKEHDFDPRADVKISTKGPLEWASNKPKLHSEIRNYLSERAS